MPTGQAHTRRFMPYQARGDADRARRSARASAAGTCRWGSQRRSAAGRSSRRVGGRDEDVHERCSSLGFVVLLGTNSGERAPRAVHGSARPWTSTSYARVLPTIRTFTVGPGVPPGQPVAGCGRVADCHRRLGVSPTPEHVGGSMPHARCGASRAVTLWARSRCRPARRNPRQSSVLGSLSTVGGASWSPSRTRSRIMAPAEGSEVTVNGEVIGLAGTEPWTNALDWLRGRGLTGAKEGCAEGECGACAVMVARPRRRGRHPLGGGQLLPAARRLARRPGGRHRRGARHARGRCTPCSTRWRCAAARSAATAPPGSSARWPPSTTAPTPTASTCEAISGNLCRCTGYRPIRDAAHALGRPAPDDPVATRMTGEAPAVGTHPGRGSDGRVRATHRPGRGATRCSRSIRTPCVVAGSTDWGVDVNLRGARAPLVIGIDRLEELRG